MKITTIKGKHNLIYISDLISDWLNIKSESSMEITQPQKGMKSAELRWMKLEFVIWSEISQKEKNKYCILMHIYGI